MAKHDVTIRLGTEGRDQLLADLRKLGDQGEKMAKQIERAGQPASRGLLAINAASKEMQGGLQGAASRGGSLGSVLASIGPAGLTAAAGLGVFAAAAGFAFKKAKEGMDFADEIDTAVKRLGMGVEALQEYRAALQVAGDASANFDDGARTLLERMGESARGKGEGVEVFKRLGIDIRNAAGEMKSVEEMLPQIADGFASLGSAAERADVANKLFGGQGQNFVAMLGQGSDALARQREEMRAMGLVMDEQVVRRYAEASDKSEMLSKAIDIQLKSAFVDLAPTIVRTLSLFAEIARAINNITDAITDLENKTSENLATELDVMVQERAGLLRDRGSRGNAGLLTQLAVPGLVNAGDAAADRRLAELDQLIARAQGELRRRESAAQPRAGVALPDIADPKAMANAQRDAQLLADLTRQIEIFGDARQQAIDNATKRLSADASPQLRADVEVLAGRIYDATQNQKELNEALQEEQKLRERGRAVMESVATDEEKFAAAKAELKHLLDSAAISAETYGRAIQAAGEQYDPAMRATKELSAELSRLVIDNLSAARSFDDLAGIADQALTRILNKMLEVHALAPLENFLSGAISGITGGLFHTGGMAGEAGPSRSIAPAFFAAAPRYHTGGLLPGEVPVIARKGEGIFTPRQMDNADALIRALAGAASRPSTPNVNVRIDAPAGMEARSGARMNGNGDLDIDIILRQVDEGLGGMISSGRSSAGEAIERRFGLDASRGLVR